MSLWNIILAEAKFVYADLFRRKSALVMIIAYPYILTLFVVLIGYAMGSRQVFIERTGAPPEIFFITAGFLLISILGVSDDLLWRPNFELWMGTLQYVLISPLPRIYRYVAIPFPRLLIVVLIGATSIIPVYIYYYGLGGLIEGVAVILLALLSGLFFTTPIMVLMGLIYGVSGESWRIINIVRPLLMILLGAYYPRYLMPLMGKIVSYLIPSSHIVEVIQLMIIEKLDVLYAMSLIGIATALFILYAPIGIKSINYWETKKLREGIR